MSETTDQINSRVQRFLDLFLVALVNGKIELAKQYLNKIISYGFKVQVGIDSDNTITLSVVEKDGEEIAGSYVL